MKKFILIGLLGLSSCMNIPSPGVLANKTLLDEKALHTAAIAYQAETIAISAGIATGVIHGETATKVKALDNNAFMAFQMARQAYAAGNAASFQEALSTAQTAVIEIERILK